MRIPHFNVHFSAVKKIIIINKLPNEVLEKFK